MKTGHAISPCLWFDSQAEEAARFYVSLFPDSRIVRISRYTDVGREVHGRPAGSVMVVAFELAGQGFWAMNGGPLFKFNEAISLAVECDSQPEIDHYWNALSAGGDPQAQQCGWLKDRYGVSWQVTPRILAELMSDPDTNASGRVMKALLDMKKLDIEALKRAYRGA